MIVSPLSDPGFAESKLHGESAQRELLRGAAKYCRQRRVCVDVGAHIGLFSLAAINDGFESVKAFEPQPENYRCLVENTATHAVHNFPFALGRHTGRIALQMGRGSNSGCWYGAELQYPMAGEVAVMRLDWFDLQRVDLIKIDVEGAEGFVLQGALATLDRCSPVVVFEDNGLGPEHFGNWVDPKEVLMHIGYRRIKRLPGKNEVWEIA